MNNYYTGNAGHIYVYKSMRKNAKMSKYIYVCHLIIHDQDEGKLTDKRIIEHFISTVDQIFAASEREFYLSVSMKENREVYKDVDISEQGWYWESNRKDFKRPTEMLHWLWFNFFCRIYPYNTVDFTKIEMNPSIKYMINKWQEAHNEARLEKVL